jgi:hypothetical protein
MNVLFGSAGLERTLKYNLNRRLAYAKFKTSTIPKNNQRAILLLRNTRENDARYGEYSDRSRSTVQKQQAAAKRKRTIDERKSQGSEKTDSAIPQDDIIQHLEAPETLVRNNDSLVGLQIPVTVTLSLADSLLENGACGISLEVGASLNLIGHSVRNRTTCFQKSLLSKFSLASSGGWSHTDVQPSRFPEFTKSLLGHQTELFDALHEVLECDETELLVGLQHSISGSGIQEWHRDTVLGQRKVISLIVYLDKFGADTRILLNTHQVAPATKTLFSTLPKEGEGAQPFLGSTFNAVLMDTNCLHKGITRAVGTEFDKLIFNFVSSTTLLPPNKLAKKFAKDFGSSDMFCNAHELLNN